MARKAVKADEAPKLTLVQTPIRLDFGCGPNKYADAQGAFQGVDRLAFDGKVDHVMDIRQTPWPWADNSVEEARASHFVEHLTGAERVVFFNELYRVLKPGAKFYMIVPHWSHDCAYGDPTHQWPPISEWMVLYLGKAWRDANAPHCGYTCDFDTTYAYAVEQDAQTRAPEVQAFWAKHYRNVLREMHATMIKRDPPPETKPG